MPRDDLKYTLSQTIKDNDTHLYSVKIFKPFELDPDCILFSAVGGNRCSIYEFDSVKNKTELVDAYVDADPEEIYYACAWSQDTRNNDPLIVIAGFKGIIRTIVPFKSTYKNALMGHGSSINELSFHPSKPQILLSASKDYTVRLWNVNTAVCVAIFGGAEGHRDEVLSADFNLQGTLVISGGIDHYLKIWNIKFTKMNEAIQESDSFTASDKSFPTVLVNFPDYSTRDIHTNYVDCVKWFGDLILSKSCENSVVLWKPGLIDESLESTLKSSKNASIICKFSIKESEVWYVRFGLDFNQRIMALGNNTGRISIWDMYEEDPTKIKPTIIFNPKSKGLIRSLAISLNGRHIISADDYGYINIWTLSGSKKGQGTRNPV